MDEIPIRESADAGFTQSDQRLRTDDRMKHADRERLFHDLGERVKELTALHGTARLLQDDTLTVEDVLKSVARLLPPSFQYPEVTEARLTFGDLSVTTPGFRMTPWCLRTSSGTLDNKSLVIEVVYVEEKPPAAEGPFLAEERNLIRSMAEMLVVFLDRRRIDNNLRENERGLRRSEFYLMETQRLSQTGSFGWNVSSGAVFWSDETFRIFGFERDTIPTLESILLRIHPQDLAAVQTLLDSAARNGTDWDIGHRLLMPGGAIKHLRIVAHAVRGASGTLEFVGAVMDITATKLAEEGLRESEERFRNLVDLIPAAVYTCDPSGRVTYQNRRSLELWEGSGMYFADGTPMTHDRSPMAEALRRGRADEGQEMIVERPDRSRIAVIVNIAVVRNVQGEVLGTINCFQDITERKRTEHALDRAFQEIRALKDQLFKENLALKEEIDRSAMFEEMVGSSPSLQATLHLVAQVAPTDSTVLITGETGTGKELLARAIHKRSRRSGRAFVSVNCAAIPQGLIGSELFGHEKGAFTGAAQRRVGRFELAEGGTIFLDEVGELPAETQIALLRVLQERSFERVGGNQSITANVRVIAATNRDLEASINAGTFRSDLFYRLNVFPLEIAPLRERKEDVPILVQYFIERFARKTGKKITTISRKTLALLESYAWPGNIRELQNVIERSVIVSATESFSVDERWLSRTSPPAPQPDSWTLSRRPETEIKQMIEAALAETRGLVSGPSGAAAKLGVPPSTLESKIRTLGIDKSRFRKVWTTPAS